MFSMSLSVRNTVNSVKYASEVCKYPPRDLGVTKDQFDVVDLTDNNIRKLHNLLSETIANASLHNNHISEIDKAIGEHLPNLKTLALTNNEVTELVDVDPLATCKTWSI
uniref:Uncharacterized protein n=1 Tax=Ditylenchus dipsaci TaxID=166011 RepID=A0A915E7Z9_9BILA